MIRKKEMEYLDGSIVKAIHNNDLEESNHSTLVLEIILN